MPAVIHMFCTLPEAARRLHTSEEQLETMLQRGILREFREGPHRLLKATDVALLAETLLPGRSSSPTGADEPSLAVDDRKVRLPHCAAATVRAPHDYLPRPRIGAQPRQQQMPGESRATGHWGPKGTRQRMEQSLVPHYRPSVPAPLSVREWFWNGLTQDRPMTIILLFGLALLLVGTVVAGICLAAKVL